MPWSSLACAGSSPPYLRRAWCQISFSVDSCANSRRSAAAAQSRAINEGGFAVRMAVAMAQHWAIAAHRAAIAALTVLTPSGGREDGFASPVSKSSNVETCASLDPRASSQRPAQPLRAAAKHFTAAKCSSTAAHGPRPMAAVRSTRARRSKARAWCACATAASKATAPRSRVEDSFDVVPGMTPKPRTFLCFLDRRTSRGEVQSLCSLETSAEASTAFACAFMERSRRRRWPRSAAAADTVAESSFKRSALQNAFMSLDVSATSSRESAESVRARNTVA
mmetsp:Transcript_7198/g.23452  ORF Transcript_7198/g.23452 Transcript_7198/m.23452 type:complete len:280 (-) Transcript_7198:240-1079(-)